MPLLQLPKHYHPDFSQPGRKPVGPVEVDWSNPLARGVFDAWVQVGGLKLNAIVNAVSNDFIQQGAPSSHPGYLSLAANNERAEATLEVPGGAFSWTIIFEKDDTSKDSLLGTGGGGVNTFGIQLYDTSGGVSVFRAGSYQARSTGVITTGTKHVLTITNNGGTGAGTYNIYVDGVKAALTSDGGETVSGGSLLHKLGERADGTEDFIGKIYAAIRHNVELSSGAVKSLHKNPYQILKPANAPVYFTPSAAGSTYTLTAEAGSVTVGGDSVNLQWDRILSADNTAYTLGGDSVNLTYSPVGSYTLTADVSAFTLGGDTVNLFYNQAIQADVTAYTLSGDSVNLTYNPVGSYTLNADITAYTLGSDAVNLTYDRIFTADVTAYTLTFATADLTVGILDTPNCYTWLIGEIVNYEYLIGDIDGSVTYLQSDIDDSITYLIGDIDGSVLYLRGDLCS